MEYILILTLLASNIFLIGKFLKKADPKPPASAPELPSTEVKKRKVQLRRLMMKIPSSPRA